MNVANVMSSDKNYHYGPKIDYTGKTVNDYDIISWEYYGDNDRLKIRWLCKCVVCETEVYRNTYHLNNNIRMECINCKKVTTKMNQNYLKMSLDYTGKLIGNVKCLYSICDETTNFKVKWMCQCNCGNMVLLSCKKLKNKYVSCGCIKKPSRIIDISNKRFGKLTTSSEYEIRNNNNCYWKCKCDCGNEKWIKTTSLINGKQESCGCIVRKNTILRNVSLRDSKHPHWNDGVTLRNTGYCHRFERDSFKERVRIFWGRNVYYVVKLKMRIKKK